MERSIIQIKKPIQVKDRKGSGSNARSYIFILSLCLIGAICTLYEIICIHLVENFS